MTQSGHFNDIKCASAPLMPSIYGCPAEAADGLDQLQQGSNRH